MQEWLKQILDHARSWQAAGIHWLPPSDAPPWKRRHDAEAEKPTTDSSRANRSASVSAAAATQQHWFEPSPSPTVPMSLEERRIALQTLDEQQVKTCTRCTELVRNRTQTVFGVGNLEAELCIVGEAPGADEDAQGEPFVGAAGQLLNRILEACQLKRSDVYICNVLKCRPPGNRPPLPDEVAHCRPFLERQLDVIQPKFICCLGASAAQTILNTNLAIGKLRKKFHTYRGIAVICTYHPAYLLRNPNAKRDVWEDMKMLMAKMGRPVS